MGEFIYLLLQEKKINPKAEPASHMEGSDI